MIVILVARKPVEGTVANNALRYGTGGINIDGCRVRYETTANAASNPLYRKQNGYKTTVGADTHPSSYKLKSEISEMKPNQAGRWPTNLIFQHLDGCKCIGNKEIKGSLLNHVCSNNEDYFGLRNMKKTGHTDSEGKETVLFWDCLPSCPVAELDRQSGDRRSALTGKADPSTTHPSPAKSGFNAERDSRRRGYSSGLDDPVSQCYADFGGASRFFKQIQVTTTEEPFIRAAGNVLCQVCGKTYLQHPADSESSWLNVLCDGTRVKL